MVAVLISPWVNIVQRLSDCILRVVSVDAPVNFIQLIYLFMLIAASDHRHFESELFLVHSFDPKLVTLIVIESRLFSRGRFSLFRHLYVNLFVLNCK